MRTTVDIQDEVLRKAKELSARSGVTLSVLVSDALRSSLAEKSEPRQPFRLPHYTPKIPGLLPGVDLFDSAALTALLEEERDAALMVLLYGGTSVDP